MEERAKAARILLERLDDAPAETNVADAQATETFVVDTDGTPSEATLIRIE